MRRSGGGGLEISTTDFRKLSNDLKGVDKKLDREMKAQLKQVAEPIRARVAAEAAQFSRRIPGATKVSTRFTAKTSAVLVTVNRKQAPHARPIENAGKQGTFRHPVFGRKNWRGKPVTAKQQSRPFFAKAVKSQDHRIDAAIEQVARDFEKKLGFK